MEHAKHRLGWVICLLVVSSIGAAAQVIKLVLNVPDLASFILLFSWVSRMLAKRTTADIVYTVGSCTTDGY